VTERRVRKQRDGVVISNRMPKTAVISVARMVKHSKYGKYLKRRGRVKAHDEKNECQIGDRVVIVECRPLSRDKRWRVSRILERAAQTAKEPENEARP
jgi:small subunit ribosomal protein S17